MEERRVEELIPEIKCLDHGFVRLIDHMGNDKRIVDAARVSYQKGTTKVSNDRNLIRYLLRNLHTTPFEKIRFEFHVKLPIHAARQWMRHRTGSFNEVSGRYSEMPNEMYVPDPIRKQSEVNKQGSSDEAVDEAFADLYTVSHAQSYEAYQALLANGVAKELARGVLPLDLYTEFYWTVDLWNLMHFLRLRLDSHAQKEIQIYAQAIFYLLTQHCDLEYSLEAFQDYILDKPNISKFELEIIRNTFLYISSMSPEALAYGENENQEAIKKHMQELLKLHPDMGKREKTESDLVDLLFLDILEENGESDEMVQPQS